jgi:hypothetical protein
MNALLQAALHYAVDLHWPIFPCNQLKEPLVEGGVTAATTDPAVITEWWETYPRANIGLDVGGAGMMALDFDPGSSRAECAKAVGGLPDTLLHQKTPRGGDHLLYALAPGEIVSASASKLSPAVDVRSFHSYILLAPSRTADGVYEWVSEGKPAYRTDELVRLANVAREKSADRDAWLIPADMPENVELATAWLKRDAKISVEGQGGDAMAYATAAHLKSFGISEPLALDLLWQHWNPRNQPPWGADEIDHLEAKVEHAYRYNTSPPGNVTPAYKIAKAQALFAPVAAKLDEAAVTDNGLAGEAGRFRFAEGDAFDDIKAPNWLIDGFLPEGCYGLLTAHPGAGKTFIALDIGLTIASEFMMATAPVWSVLTHGAVLYAAGEGRSQIPKRKRAWEKLHYGGARVRGFVLADPMPNVANDEDWTAFIAGALGMSPGGYKLVVLDTIGRAMQGLNENAQEHASNFTKRVEQLQRALGCAVLALHHSGHDGTRARGSSVFGADADVSVVLERDGQAPVVSLRMEKQKDAEQWEIPRRVALEETSVGDGIKSLVAMPAVTRREEAMQHVQAVKHKNDPTRKNDGAAVMVLDAAVKAVLASNTGKAWSTADLAQAVAMRDEVEISSKTLANRGLPELRETRGTYANKAYDAATKRWRSVSPA